jgi:hypothetical protein
MFIKFKIFLVCYLNTYNILWHEIWLSFVNNCMSYAADSLLDRLKQKLEF